MLDTRRRKTSWFDSEKSRLARLLSEYTGEEASVAVPTPPTAAGLVVRTASHTFFVVARSAATAGPLIRAAEHLREQIRGARATPLVVVPFMGPTGRAALRELGMSWLDLSGNALRARATIT